MLIEEINVREFIVGFDPPAHIHCQKQNSNTVHVIDNGSENSVCSVEQKQSATVRVRFSKSSARSKVLIGRQLRGSIDVTVHGKDSLVYIGNDCILRGLEIRSFQNNDCVLIGAELSTAGNVQIVSGNGSGTATPHILIGDHCMFSYAVTIRNTDAHPIVNGHDLVESGSIVQLNEPVSGVVIEPNVWLGQDVSILKDVRVGACSIVGLGSVVSSSLKRFSIAKGIPAAGEVRPECIWLRDRSAKELRAATHYMKRFAADRDTIE